MRTRTKTFVLGLAAVAAFGAAALGVAVAEDPPAHGEMAMQKKVDHALAKALVGTWKVSHASPHGAATGTSTFALGVGDTALMQEYSVASPEGSFVGHGVWKVSDDGKTLQCWWIDVMSPEMQHFKGSLSETGFDVKASDGTRLTLAKTDKGYEFKLFMGSDEPVMTDTWTK